MLFKILRMREIVNHNFHQIPTVRDSIERNEEILQNAIQPLGFLNMSPFKAFFKSFGLDCHREVVKVVGNFNPYTTLQKAPMPHKHETTQSIITTSSPPKIFKRRRNLSKKTIELTSKDFSSHSIEKTTPSES